MILTLKEAKGIPLKKILGRLGHEPVGEAKNADGQKELLYFSPLRKEKKPSFSVNVEKNVFQDFGFGGGDVLDFISAFYKTDFKGALRRLKDLSISDQGNGLEIDTRAIKRENKSVSSSQREIKNQNKLVSTKEIYFYPIKNYIKKKMHTPGFS